MMRYLLSLAFVLCAVSCFAQGSLAPMMRELPQRALYNPALEVSSDAYFSVPGLGGVSLSAENSGFSFGDVFARGADDSLHFDLDHLASSMRRRSLTSVNVSVPILAVGFRAGERNHVSIGVTNKTAVDVILPQSVLDFRFGNYDYDRQRPVNAQVSDVFVRAMNYTELAVGFDRWLTENLRAGARLKLLAGTAAAQSDDLRLRVKTIRDSEMRSRLEVSSSGSLVASAPIDVETDAAGIVEKVQFQDDVDVKSFGISKNKGVALDFGATLRMWDLVTLGASVTDLGFINWKSNPHRFRAGQSYTFRGYNMNEQVKESTRDEDKDDYWAEMRDSLERFTDVSHVASHFRTPLGGSMLLTGEMDLFDWLSVGGMARFRAVGGRVFSSGAVSGQVHVSHWLSYAVSMSLEHGARPSLGTALVLTGGAFQFFVMSDRLPLRLVDANGASLSVGVNFVIGHRHYDSWRRSAPSPVELD